ncbi:MAG: hypothetical protein Q4B42_03825 [Oscillospiraceae bacterium]|nr:hypothetical protein [Oscillospiraceae bacterium]
MMRWLYRMEYKYGRWAVQDLMKIIAIGQLAVYLVNYIFPAFNLISWMSLTRAGLFGGQVWRLFTFLLVPPETSVLFVLISLYFYYFIGSSLERTWGAFMFNAYYFIGALGAVLAALLTGYGTNYYLNMSMFLAFAILYPDFEVLLFFILPVKMKWLAIIDAVIFGYSLIFGTWSTRIAIAASLINLIIFFGPRFIQMIKANREYAQTRRRFREQTAEWNRNNRGPYN